MKKKQLLTETRNRSRIEILNYIISMCTFKYFTGSKYFSTGEKDKSFHGSIFDKQDPPIGSLCALGSAPNTKYYLGWLREIKPDASRYGTEYLLESIEDGSLCWWSNIQIWYLPLETTDKFPEWQWIDKQYEFLDKIRRVERKVDSYMIRITYPEFSKEGGVKISARKKFGDVFQEKNFPNWKKVLSRDIESFLKESIELWELEKTQTIKSNG